MVKPGIFRARDRSLLVIDAVVSQDGGLCRIGCRDLRPSVDQAVRLIKIDGLGDVVGDDGILLPQFGNTIHLHRQQHRDTLAPQIAGQQDCRGSSPTVAEENYAGPSLLFAGKNSVVIRVQKSNDGIVGSLPPPVLEDTDKGLFGNSSLDLLRQLNRAVVRAVVSDEATHKTDHNAGRSGGGLGAEHRAIQSSRESRHDHAQKG